MIYHDSVKINTLAEPCNNSFLPSGILISLVITYFFLLLQYCSKCFKYDKEHRSSMKQKNLKLLELGPLLAFFIYERRLQT